MRETCWFKRIFGKHWFGRWRHWGSGSYIDERQCRFCTALDFRKKL